MGEMCKTICQDSMSMQADHALMEHPNLFKSTQKVSTRATDWDLLEWAQVCCPLDEWIGHRYAASMMK